MDDLTRSLATAGLQPKSARATSLFQCLAELFEDRISKLNPTTILEVLVGYGKNTPRYNPKDSTSEVHYGTNIPGDVSDDVKWEAWLTSLTVDSDVPAWFLQLVVEKFKLNIDLYVHEDEASTHSLQQFVNASERCKKHVDLSYIDGQGYMLLRKSVPRLDATGTCVIMTDLSLNNIEDQKIVGNVMSALLNLEGGSILVRHNGRIASAYKQTQDWISRMEDFIRNNSKDHGIPTHIFRKYVDVRYTSPFQEISYSITKSSQCITKDYNAFYRTTIGCRKIDDYQIMIESLKPSNNTTLQCCYTNCNGFVYNKCPLSTNEGTVLTEDTQCEFKYYHATRYETMVKSICGDDNKRVLKKTVSAFGNSKGGTIYVGIKEPPDTSPLVMGQRLDEEEHDPCQNEIVSNVVQSCLWDKQDKQAAHLNEYDVKFLPVDSDCDNNNTGCVNDEFCPCNGRRFVIALTINKFCGGVFVRTPLFYRFNQDGEVTLCSSLDEWKERVLALDPNIQLSQ